MFFANQHGHKLAFQCLNFSSKMLNLFKTGGPKKPLTYQFFPCNFYKYWNTKYQIPNASPKLLNLNQEHPSKKFVFSSQIRIKLRI